MSYLLWIYFSYDYHKKQQFYNNQSVCKIETDHVNHEVENKSYSKVSCAMVKKVTCDSSQVSDICQDSR
jgi:hypothetical protein